MNDCTCVSDAYLCPEGMKLFKQANSLYAHALHGSGTWAAHMTAREHYEAHVEIARQRKSERRMRRAG